MKTRRRFTILFFCVICPVIASISVIVYSQTAKSLNDNTIKYTPFPSQPIEITGLKLSDQLIGFSTPFQSDNEWMKKISIDIKNVSGKNIVFVEIGLDFPLNDFPLNDPRRANYRIPMYYGHQPDFRNKADYKTIFASSETATLTVNEKFVDLFNRILSEKGSGEALNKTNSSIRVTKIYFDDNTLWAGGTLFKRDNETQKWIRVGKYDQILKTSQLTENVNYINTKATKEDTAIHFKTTQGRCRQNGIEDTFCGNCGEEIQILVNDGPGFDALRSYWTYIPCYDDQDGTFCNYTIWESTEGDCPYGPA